MNAPLHASDDRLIDLVNHLLSPDEEKLTMAHIEACAACETRFRVVLVDHETAKSLPSARTDGKGVISLPRRRPRRLGAVASLIAAAIVVAIAGYVALHRSTPGPYWIETEVIPTLQRGEDELAAPTLTDAFAAYARHDARAAAEQLRDAPVPNDEMLSSLRLLLLASAEVNAGQARESLADLEKLSVDTLPSQWRSEARWVQYLALRDAGQTDAARVQLQALASLEGKIGQMARAEKARIEKR